MVDESAVAEFFSLEAGVWTIAGIMGLLLFRIWNSVPALVGRWIEWRKLKAAEKAADWARLRDMLHEERTEAAAFRREQLAENEQCRAALAEVREELAQERAERMKLQAIIDGMGEVRKAAAAAAAEVRLDAVDKAGKERKPE